MFKYIKYLNPLIMFALAYISFTHTGILCWLVMFYSWGFVPLLELFVKPNTRNMTAAEQELAKVDKLYDYLLYLVVLIQVPMLFFFLHSFVNVQLSVADVLGRITSMGMLCGIFGINVAHELGHRNKSFDQWLAKISLLTSMYTHFFIEHNKGHHKNVATPNDPSSSRYNEMVYTFYFRTISLTYIYAWHIANAEMKKKGNLMFSLKNEMLQLQILQLAVIATIYFLFGGTILLYFFAAAFMGILLLETVNYIEHYGLQRKQTSETSYERTQVHHSWNSNHVIGRMLLFELSRHSDHHYMASRKYQVLQHHDNAPQLPTGYPGSMLLALLPPIWFSVMNKKIKALQV